MSFYENERYIVDTCNFRDSMIEDNVRGYGLFNKATGIREGEFRRLSFAITLAERFNGELDRIENGTPDTLETLPVDAMHVA